jgi:hypothetical protein
LAVNLTAPPLPQKSELMVTVGAALIVIVLLAMMIEHPLGDTALYFTE